MGSQTRSSLKGRLFTREKLAMLHPVTGEPVSFEAELPEDMANLLEKLR